MTFEDFFKIKYLICLLISVILSTLIFIWTRIPRNNMEFMINPEEGGGGDMTDYSPLTLDQNDLICHEKIPYTIIHNKNTDLILLCLNRTENPVTLKCPGNSYFNSMKNICEEQTIKDTCLGKADGTKIPIMSEYYSSHNLPQNRSYHVCRDNKIIGTFACPTNEPLFDKNKCVPNNICYKKPNGWKMPHPQLKSSYYECIDNKEISKNCPENHHFYHNHCVLKDACFEKPNGYKMPVLNRSEKYIECLNGKSVKRKCLPLHDFHRIKKQCVERNPCLGNPNKNFSYENDYAKRTHVGIQCDSSEHVNPIICESIHDVFDENIGKCRSFNNLVDLKPGRVFPVNSKMYYDNKSPDIKLLDATSIVDTDTGLIKSVCLDKLDGTKLKYDDDIRKYILCSGNQHETKLCGQDEIFQGNECIFYPCLLQDSNSSGLVPTDNSTRYNCRENTAFSFFYTCPYGTKPVSPNFTRCGLDNFAKTDDINDNFPKIKSFYSFSDTRGQSISCVGSRVMHLTDKTLTINMATSKFLFKCVDQPCSKINFSSWPLIPLNVHEGVQCYEDKIIKYIDCQPNQFINFEKVFLGKYNLPDCVSSRNQSNTIQDTLSTINLDTFYITLFDRNQNFAINEDVFIEREGLRIYRNGSLENNAEDIRQSLGSIVSKNDIENYSPFPPDATCNPGEINKLRHGYPKFYIKCATNSRIRCPINTIYLGGMVKSVNVYPVFSNCRLFALGTSQNDYRLFKCPIKAPYFNYTQQKCVKNIIAGQMLCEEFYWKNYELMSYARSLSLPKVKSFREDIG